MLRSHRKSLAAFFALTWIVQGFSAWITLPAVKNWYPHLAKPSWTPPDEVFGPVWTVLYIFIATAGWRCWLALKDMPVKRLRHAALRLWALQLLCNLGWSYLFFGLHRPELALVDITVLLLLIAGFIRNAYDVDRVAATLFIPYFLWVAYAALLNTAILQLN